MDVQQDQTECALQADSLIDLVGGGDDGDGATLTDFTPEERTRLARLRRSVVRGERSDAYPVDRRQDFVRWLIDQGKLSDN